MSAIKKWKEIKRELAYQKYSRKIEKVIFELPNGSQNDFYIKKEGPASSILAITTDKKVILVKQYRPGPQEILNELPGGYGDPDEDPLSTASRELTEETGYKGELEFIGTSLDDAYSTMERYCYVARNCKKIGEPQNTQTEQTEVVLMPLKEFREHLRKGRLTDVEVGYLGLDYLKLL
jgi:ADP-ribose pyrophosphatase